MRERTRERSTLVAVWDFENMALRSSDITEADSWIRDQVNRRFASTSRRVFKAFAHPNQCAATDVLMDLGWRVWEEPEDIDGDLIHQSKSDCGQDPEGTIFLLIAKDRDYRDLIDELRSDGVRVYLLAPRDTSHALVSAVGRRRWIEWPSLPEPSLRGAAPRVLS